MTRGTRIWLDWAERLRELMVSNRIPELSKFTADIHQETGTAESLERLQSRGFWNACQRGSTDWDAFLRTGFQITFETDEPNRVSEVSFRLDEETLESMCQ